MIRSQVQPTYIFIIFHIYFDFTLIYISDWLLSETTLQQQCSASLKICGANLPADEMFLFHSSFNGVSDGLQKHIKDKTHIDTHTHIYVY